MCHRPASAWPARTFSPTNVAEEDQPDQEVRQQRTVEAELGTALDQLRHAELGPLGGVIGHEHTADDPARHDRQDRRHQAEAELDPDRAENDRERRGVGGEPEREQAARGAEALRVRNGLDRVLLDNVAHRVPLSCRNGPQNGLITADHSVSPMSTLDRATAAGAAVFR
jgi:hypothetical protein